MSDRKLRQDIVDELEFEPSVEAAHIGVAVDAGVVTLSGHVSSFAQRLAAETAVRRVKGVQAIAQEIDVRYPDEKKTADDEIAKRAVDILRWNAVVPRDRVQIMVHLGWVTLAGEVDWQYQRAAAEDEIRRLSGVAKIVNNITIKPRVQPADVRNRIEAAFRRHASIDADRVHVAILNGGTAKLEGSVHDWSERTAAEHAAWSAPGVVEVDNRLTVS